MDAPAHIGPELFGEFRSPRRGAGNPEVMTNPVWAWLVESGLSAYSANKLLGGPSSMEAGPCWCFDRFGITETKLPDGRIVKIAGEHEDFYDPDFYIYNDVVAFDPDGRIEIFGYPEEAFPPTDFHTADLIGDSIIIIGNLGYVGQRGTEAQVLTLDTRDFSVERIEAGRGPGWIHKHASRCDDGASILVHGGLICDPRWRSPVENIDEWRLDLKARRWERLTEKKWPRFVFTRADGGPNHLYLLRDELARPGLAQSGSLSDYHVKRLRELGDAPRFDLLPILYAPALSHVALPRGEGDYGVHRISVDGVAVRYVERGYDVTLTVEGDLAPDSVEALRLDLLGKLEAIENAAIACSPIDL